MFYQNDYIGSPWQHDETFFGVGGYNQDYGRRYIDVNREFYEMRNSDFSRTQRSYDMYRNEMENNLSTKGYGGHFRHYMNNRISRGSLPRSSLSRKRLHIQSPNSDLDSKRPNIESTRIPSKTRRFRGSRRKVQNKNYHINNDEGVKPKVKLPEGECGSFDCWKPSDENKKVDGSKQNDEQITHSTESGRKRKKKSAKKHFCYVCKVKCTNKETLDEHKNSKTHTDKLEEFLAIRREIKGDGTAENTETGDLKTSYRYPRNWCTVCECTFTGYYHLHRKTNEHQVNRDKKFPKCRPCHEAFSNFEKYKDHCKTQDHKLKSAEFHYLTNIASEFDDDDEEALKHDEEEAKGCKELNIEEKNENMDSADGDTSNEDKGKTSNRKSENKESKEKKEETEAEKNGSKVNISRVHKPIAKSFVVPFQGYYCKLCHKFFKNVTVAKYKHCCSIMHLQAFEKAMDEALAKVEERQRTDGIAKIESAAKESIRKKPAAKEAFTETVDNNVEMDEVKNDSKSNEEDEKPADDNKPGIKNGIQNNLKAGLEEFGESNDGVMDKNTEESEVKDVQSTEEQEKLIQMQKLNTSEAAV